MVAPALPSAADFGAGEQPAMRRISGTAIQLDLIMANSAVASKYHTVMAHFREMRRNNENNSNATAR